MGREERGLKVGNQKVTLDWQIKALNFLLKAWKKGTFKNLFINLKGGPNYPYGPWTYLTEDLTI